MSESAPPIDHQEQPDDPSMMERAEARADSLAQRFDKSDWIELLAALLLALATISAAWCAYQSTRWGGVQANAYASAGALRQESVRASNRFFALVNIDVSTFLTWIDARRAQDILLAEFWEARFRPEFKPAFDAWLASAPAGEIPPGTPFDRAEYAPADRTLADDLQKQAEDSAAEARKANQTGDNFVLLAVLFASVLFFAGVGTKFKGYRVRVAMVSFATVFYLVALVFVLILPQNIGI